MQGHHALCLLIRVTMDTGNISLLEQSVLGFPSPFLSYQIDRFWDLRRLLHTGKPRPHTHEQHHFLRNPAAKREHVVVTMSEQFLH